MGADKACFHGKYRLIETDIAGIYSHVCVGRLKDWTDDFVRRTTESMAK
jgi:hypothetical protein